LRRFSLAVLAVLSVLALLQLSRRQLPEPQTSSDSRRLISLAPNLTTLVFELGLGNDLVGVTTYCDDPPEAQTREKVGNLLNPNLEKILALKPTLVLAERWSSSRTVPRLRQLGLEVFETPTPRSLREIRDLISGLGTLLDRQSDADRLIQTMRKRLEGVQERARRYAWTPRVYIEIDVPAWTVGRISFTNEALALSGFSNIFSDVDQPAPRVSTEAIIERNPDIIISFAAPAEAIAARPGWQNIAAVQRNWIIDDFAEAWLSRGNDRLVEGMELLQQRVERLPHWDPIGPPPITSK